MQMFAPQEGVQVPCGRCSRCSDCLCHSKASDGKCPPKCAFESAWVTLFQGLFAVENSASEEISEDTQLGRCAQYWDVQGRFFSSYYAWIPSGSVHGDGDQNRPNCTEQKVDGVFELDTIAVPSLMRLSYIGTSGQTCHSKLAHVSNDCKGGLQVEWDTSEDSTACREATFPSSAFRLVRSEDEIVATNYTPWTTSWEGTVSMYSTTCTAAFSFTSLLPSHGLFRWFADIFNCSVGPDPAEARPDGLRQSAISHASSSARRDATQQGQKDHRVVPHGRASANNKERKTERRSEASGEIPSSARAELEECAYVQSGNLSGCQENSRCYHAFHGDVWDPSNRTFDGFWQLACVLNETAADKHEECRAANHSFVCRCDVGFSRNGPVCVDVDECGEQLHDCNADADCTNTVSSFVCACWRGFAGDGVLCTEVDECAASSHSCHWQAACSNSRGSFMCACTKGFEGSGLGCKPTSEIEAERVYPNGIHFVFVLTWTMTGRAHPEDVIAVFKLGVTRRQLLWLYSTASQCEKPQATCVGNQCTNPCHRPGPADTGLSRSLNIELASAGFGTYRILLFSSAARTVVAETTYTLTRPPPVSTPPPTPGDEETAAVSATPPPAPPGTVYFDAVPPDTGYTAEGGLDDCDLDGGPCDFVFSEASSVFVPGKSAQAPPFLRCGDGRLSADNGERCDDGNGLGGDGCNGTCFLEQGWNCTVDVIPELELDEATGLYHTVGPGGDSKCERGPHCGDGRRNVEGEECDDGNGQDSDGCSAECWVEGGWECVREAEGEPEGELCSGVVELQFDQSSCPLCHIHGECVLYRGVERCRCQTGFALDASDITAPNPMRTAEDIRTEAHHCEDIDECGWARLAHLHLCEHETLACINTAGSFECSCGRGEEYIPADDGNPASRAQCVDINECTRVDSSTRTGRVHDCHVDARCSNTVGSYACDCPEYFAGDGIGAAGCVDINECLNMTYKCSTQASCLNHRFGFTCQCGPGLAGSGFVCIDEGWYGVNRAWWERMGQDGVAVRRWGQLHVTDIDYFLPHRVGRAQLRVSGEDGVEFAGMFQIPSQRIPPTLSCGGLGCERVTEVGAGEGRVEVELQVHTSDAVCAWTVSKFVGEFVAVTVHTFDLEPGLHSLLLCQHRDRARLFNFYRQGAYDCEAYNATNPPPRHTVLPTPAWVELHTVSLPLSDPSARQWPPRDPSSPQRGRLILAHRTFASQAEIPPSLQNSQPFPVRYVPGIWPEVPGPGLVLSVTNDVGPGVQPPCSFESGYRHPHSTYKLTPRHPVPMLEGMWKGECSTAAGGRVAVETCKVDMMVEKGILQMWVSGCDGIVGAGLTTGRVVAVGGPEKQWLSVETDVRWMQRYELHFTAGDERKTRFGSRTIGRASIIWPDSGSDIPQYHGGVLAMGVIRPGEQSAAGTEYPGDYPDTMEFGTHDCGVMTLRPVVPTDITFALPAEGETTAFLHAALAVNRYRDCNASVFAVATNLSQSGPACAALAPLLDTRRWPSLPEVATWERVCRSACYPHFRRILAETVSVCTEQWHQFAANPWVNAFAAPVAGSAEHRVSNFFAARVATVLDVTLRLDLACQYNLDDVSCLATASASPAVFSACPLYSARGAGWATALDFVTPPFALPDKIGAGSTCPLECWNGMLQATVSGHCCHAFVSAAKEQWRATFAPRGLFPIPYDLDLAPYTCGYDLACLARPIPYRFQRSAVTGSCIEGARGVVSEPCAHAACDADLTHAACCDDSNVNCGDGGRTPYRGACWCVCSFPRVGAECTRRAVHVTVEVTIEEMTLHRFDEGAFLRALTRAANVGEGRAEMGAVLQVAGRRRDTQSGDERRESEARPNARRDAGDELRSSAGGRRSREAVVASARIMAADEPDAIRVAKWLNGEGGDLWLENIARWVALSVPLGTTGSSDMRMSAKAVPVAADGTKICPDCRLRPQLQDPDDAGSGVLSRSAGLGLGLGTLVLVCCVGACYVRHVGAPAFGGVPHRLAALAREASREAGDALRGRTEMKRRKEQRQAERASRAKQRGVFQWRGHGEEDQAEQEQARPYFAGPQLAKQGVVARVSSGGPEGKLAVFRKTSFGRFTLPSAVPPSSSSSSPVSTEMSQRQARVAAEAEQDVEVSMTPGQATTVGVEWPRSNAGSKQGANAALKATGREGDPDTEGKVDWVRKVIEGHEQLARQQQELLSGMSSVMHHRDSPLPSSSSPHASSSAPLSPPSPLSSLGPASLWSPHSHLGATLSKRGKARALYPGLTSNVRAVRELTPITETAAITTALSPALSVSHSHVDESDLEGSVASLLGRVQIPPHYRTGRFGLANNNSHVGLESTTVSGSVSSWSAGSETVRSGWFGARGPIAVGEIPEDNVSFPAGVTRMVLESEERGALGSVRPSAFAPSRPLVPAPSIGDDSEPIIFDEVAVTPVTISRPSSGPPSVASLPPPPPPPPSLPLPGGDVGGWGAVFWGDQTRR